MERIERLFQAVQWRLSVVSVAVLFSRMILILGLMNLIVILSTRLTGSLLWLSQVEITLGLVPFAILISLLFHRRSDRTEAARRVDESTGAKDLFLTISHLDKSLGEFQPLVVRSGESRLPEILPKRIIPYRLDRRAYWAAGMIPCLCLASWLTPILDPFGVVETSLKTEAERDELRKQAKASEERILELERKKDDDDSHEKIDRELDEMLNTLKQAKPTLKKGTEQKLRAARNKISKLRKTLNPENLREILSQREDQLLGGANAEKLAQWGKELRGGSASSLTKEIQSIQEEMTKIAEMKPGEERAEALRKMSERIDDLSDFAKKNVQSPSLQAALKQALKNSQALADNKLSTEAQQALKSALQQSQMELEEIGQNASDMKRLEKALETIRMAMQLNDQEMLDGAEEGDESLESYSEFYRRMLAEGGVGDTGGEGQGMGGGAEHDDSVETGFKSEYSKTQLQKGKVLLSLKSKGMGEANEVESAYQELIQDVRQNLSEAIESEQVPAGYYEGIQKYFDSLEQDADQTDSQPENPQD